MAAKPAGTCLGCASELPSRGPALRGCEQGELAQASDRFAVASEQKRGTSASELPSRGPALRGCEQGELAQANDLFVVA
jgi:hypothetical protein